MVIVGRAVVSWPSSPIQTEIAHHLITCPLQWNISIEWIDLDSSVVNHWVEDTKFHCPFIHFQMTYSLEGCAELEPIPVDFSSKSIAANIRPSQQIPSLRESHSNNAKGTRVLQSDSFVIIVMDRLHFFFFLAQLPLHKWEAMQLFWGRPCTATFL